MRTKNGMVISIKPEEDQTYANFTYTQMGDGSMYMEIGNTDSVDLFRTIAQNFNNYPENLRNNILQTCMRIVTDNHYVIRKAGC